MVAVPSFYRWQSVGGSWNGGLSTVAEREKPVRAGFVELGTTLISVRRGAELGLSVRWSVEACRG